MRKIFITLLILLLGTPLLSLSATTQEVEELFQEGKTICLIAARRCTFKMVDLDLPSAYTQYNDITIMSGIYNKLTKDELRGNYLSRGSSCCIKPFSTRTGIF